MSQEVYEMITRLDRERIETHLVVQCAPMISGMKVSNLLNVEKKLAPQTHKAIKSDTEVISKDSASETVNIVHESTTYLSELITTNGSYVINFGFMIQESRPTVLPGNLRYWLTVM